MLEAGMKGGWLRKVERQKRETWAMLEIQANPGPASLEAVGNQVHPKLMSIVFPRYLCHDQDILLEYLKSTLWG